MTPREVSVATFSVIFLASVAVGFLARARRNMDLDQWAVGGRHFGAVLAFLLMVGETYTTFAFLGASGWVYSRGAPTFYIIAYVSLAYVISFFILPAISELGRRHGMHTQSDFFSVRYRSKKLTALVCIVGLIFIIPYIQLQITGLGMIVAAATFDGIERTPAMVISMIVLLAFVLFGGIRAIAWISVPKDILMAGVVIAVGVGVPLIYFGGVGSMFTAVAQYKPTHLTMPGPSGNLGHAWYVSTVLLTALGYYMWPQTFGAAFTAKSSNVLRRNAIIMPIYSLTFPFIFFVGFASVLVLPNLRNGDAALLTIVRQSFPPWFVGVLGAAGVLTAMVPASVLLLTAATLFSKNFYRSNFAPEMTDEQVTKLARVVVVVIGLMCLVLAIRGSTSLVSLLLTGYAGMTQFFPGVVFGLYWRNADARAVLVGLIVGLVVVAVLMLSDRDPWFGMSAGFVALCANFLVTACFGLAAPLKRRESSRATKMAIRTETVRPRAGEG